MDDAGIAYVSAWMCPRLRMKEFMSAAALGWISAWLSCVYMASLVCWMFCWLSADSLALAWLAATLPHDCMAHADGPSWVCMVKLRPAWFLRAARSWWVQGSCLVLHLVSICCRSQSFSNITTCWKLLSGPPHCLAYPVDSEMCPSLCIKESMLAAALGVLKLEICMACMCFDWLVLQCADRFCWHRGARPCMVSLY
ncbi:hypothetical protein NC653_031991 [Populus alba x Populus x berolinensis]|uniref:Uncharacterized protein n=2 Tax=Populus TaxID=3689 RepID=A0A4U5QJQ8_POPAL|nr:hypothetical protein NC653_031991 [Populus alba x Populus x berolinensis]TKS10934.1 hypothetical protein D5086_0000078390 [Populus alba]